MQAEDDTDLPGRAHKGTGHDRVKGIDGLIAVGQHQTQPGSRRANQQEGERHGDHQAQQRVTKLRNALCNTRLNSGSRRQDTQAAKMIGITDEL
ncbi:Uncharacterised protein [Serratia fonticola]|uniref:Uncharacterized protein n=1 Tax=Serratia fonticola TaxID=47917 RepID=A0A4U9WJT3_SERFO|nr:Uncharacterised protein [Serratia fonticola]